MRIVLVTAGAAGMYCGSCMRDNALVAALCRIGHDALLLPTYTPVTLDEPDQSRGPVLLGGINIYLQDKLGFFRKTPRWVDWLFNRPWLLKFAGRFAGSTDYKKLGGLTLSMLKGLDGRQKKEVESLIEWFRGELKPDVIILTNVLLSGIVPALKQALGVPIVATLQGDDIFLDELSDADRDAAIRQIRSNIEMVDRLIATSAYYADHMASYLGIDRMRIDVVPAGIETVDHFEKKSNPTPVIGYFARLAPEKGLGVMVDAFLELRKSTNAKLKLGGWRGPKNEAFIRQQLKKIDQAGLTKDVEVVSSPNKQGKIDFLKSLDLFSVPSIYKEPKGLFLFEAWSFGLPVVVPEHGCFPELVNDTGGGILVPPNDPISLARTWQDLLKKPDCMTSMGSAGQRSVRERYTSRTMADRTASLLENLVRPV